ncbi:MAG: hypothetical protein E7A56_11475, partial [Cutibacterium avidum]|nr:hypothetical protein [Cutibacterium avidum]
TIRGAHEVVHLHSQGVEEVLGAGAITMGGDEVEPAPSAPSSSIDPTATKDTTLHGSNLNEY